MAAIFQRSRKHAMRRTALVAVVLAVNVAGCDRPVVHAATMSTAAARSTDAPSSTGEEQGMPAPGPRSAPERPGPVQPPDVQGFSSVAAPNALAAVTLPDNFSAVTTLFNQLP